MPAHHGPISGHVDRRPPQIEPGHRGRGTFPADDDHTVGVEVGRCGQAFGQRVRHGPASGGAAQRRGGLDAVGIRTGVEFPGAEAGEHGSHQGFPCTGRFFGLQNELVTAGGVEGLPGLPTVFQCVIAEFEDHDRPANIARDNRIRCISMLPDDTVDACE